MTISSSKRLRIWQPNILLLGCFVVAGCGQQPLSPEEEGYAAMAKQKISLILPHPTDAQWSDIAVKKCGPRIETCNHVFDVKLKDVELWRVTGRVKSANDNGVWINQNFNFICDKRTANGITGYVPVVMAIENDCHENQLEIEQLAKEK